MKVAACNKQQFITAAYKGDCGECGRDGETREERRRDEGRKKEGREREERKEETMEGDGMLRDIRDNNERNAEVITREGWENGEGAMKVERGRYEGRTREI